MTGEHYGRTMRHLQALPAIGLVTTGRTGSDFLQSLLDGHPQVLMFNGNLQFYADFLASSVCARAESPAIGDILDEFVGRYIHRFKSWYDFVERKDQLGAARSESLDVDTGEFRRHASALMEGHAPSRRNLLLAIYGAYNLCAGRDPSTSQVLFHHAHRFDELDLFLREFPGASVIVTTRDPRANFVAGIEHGRSVFTYRDNQKHLYHYLNHVLDDSTPCESKRVRYAAVRLEDLPKEDTMRAIAAWVGVEYRPEMLESTWGGLRWYGDRLSPEAIEENRWTPTRTYNDWERRLSKKDRYLFNALMFTRLRHYGYPCTPPRWWDPLVVPLLLCLPLRHERRFFSYSYMRREPGRRLGRILAELSGTCTYYLLRVRRTLLHYFRAARGRPFRGPWIGLDVAGRP